MRADLALILFVLTLAGGIALLVLRKKRGGAPLLIGGIVLLVCAAALGLYLAASVLLVLAVGFAVTAPKKPGEPSELKEVLQEAAEAMSLDKETMEKEVEQAVSAFEENIGAEELDGGEKQ